ncbi:hypothetical protein AKO1_010810 [Acrasis kona]|uniref:Protein AATF n=1 Tax=Acrasis kona TaxID=1008807 RepID=A0AAW2YKQ2_9EUKA
MHRNTPKKQQTPAGKSKKKTLDEIFIKNHIEDDPEDEGFDRDDFTRKYSNDVNENSSAGEINEKLSMRSSAIDSDLTTGAYAGSSISRKEFIDEDDMSSFRRLLKDDKQHAEEIKKATELLERERPKIDFYENDSDEGDINLSELEENNRNEIKLLKNERLLEKQKAVGVFNQKLLFNHLLKVRILMQKPLSTCNRLPQPDTFEAMVANANSQDKIDAVTDSILQTISSLSSMQDDLLQQNTQTLSSVEADTDHDYNEMYNKRRKLNDGSAFDEIWSSLDQQYLKFSQYRETSLERWNRKTRLQAANVKNLKIMNTSVIEQVAQAIKADDKLMERCQLKRFEENILGKEQPEHEEEAEEPQVDFELFDDRDFYQTLLKDLIQDVGSSVVDPKSREAAQARRKLLGSTKGRTIRYHVHKKLVGFMAPVDQDVPESATNLFNNLFGGNTVPQEYIDFERQAKERDAADAAAAAAEKKEQ